MFTLLCWIAFFMVCRWFWLEHKRKKFLREHLGIGAGIEM